jgi:hypothetical protein
MTKTYQRIADPTTSFAVTEDCGPGAFAAD